MPGSFFNRDRHSGFYNIDELGQVLRCGIRPDVFCKLPLFSLLRSTSFLDLMP